jgi:hypothetical protein
MVWPEGWKIPMTHSGIETAFSPVPQPTAPPRIQQTLSCVSRRKWRTEQYNVTCTWDHWVIKYSMRFIHLAVCLTTGPKLLPKRALHIVRSRTSSFRCEYPFPSWRSSSSFLLLLHRLPVTSIHHFIFPSVTCCRKQFLRKVWRIQFTFRLLISCRIFLTA